MKKRKKVRYWRHLRLERGGGSAGGAGCGTEEMDGSSKQQGFEEHIAKVNIRRKGAIMVPPGASAGAGSAWGAG